MSQIAHTSHPGIWGSAKVSRATSESTSFESQPTTPNPKNYSASDMVQSYNQLKANNDLKMPSSMAASAHPLTSAHPQDPLSATGLPSMPDPQSTAPSQSSSSRLNFGISTQRGSVAGTAASIAPDPQSGSVYSQWSPSASDARRVSSASWLFNDPLIRQSPLAGGGLGRASVTSTSAAVPTPAAVSSGPPGISAGPPPGLMVNPESIQWVYTDLSGTVQGPFPGSSMHAWHLGNYLSDDLQLKRMQDKEFVTLRDLKSRLGVTLPFGSNLSAETWERAFSASPPAPAAPAPGAGGSSAEYSWGSPWASRNPSVQEDRRFSSMFSNLNIEESARSPRADPAIVAPTPQSVVSPSATAASLAARAPSAPIAAPTAQSSAHISAPAPPIESHATPQDAAPAAAAQGSEIVDVIASPELPAQEPEVLPEEPELAWTNRPAGQNLSLKEIKEREMARKHAEQAVKTVPPPAPASSHNGPHSFVAEETPSAVSDEPAWTRRVSTPKISLKEIKEREAERKKKQVAEDERRAAEVRARMLASAASQPSQPAPAPLPSTWATAPAAPQQPARSIAEIKQELAAKSAAAKKQQQQLHQHQAEHHAPQQPHQQIQQQQISQRPHDATKRPNAYALKPTRAPAGKPAYAQQPVAAPAQPLKPASITEELVQWCRVTFKQSLMKDVNHEELLELFLSMPVSPDAKEFIAESIYSYSTVLDGRRFAHEFLQRRKEADAQLKPGETWKDVLARLNPDIETDPSFKVVSRKKFRPITHPQ